MKKVTAFISIAFSIFGFKTFAQELDSRTNEFITEFSEIDYTLEELEYLKYISEIEPKLYQEIIKQKLKIKGTKHFDIFATANKGGGPCVSGQEQ